ncbi:metallophosphoesterase family protein [Kaarinaea lacus]
MIDFTLCRFLRNVLADLLIASQPQMKIAIISDTHGSIAPGILSVIRETDLCIHAGDIGCAAVIQQLESENISVVAVLGNNDVVNKWPAQDSKWLEKIPSEQVVNLPGGQICVEHGHRIAPVKLRHDKLRKKYNNAKAIVYGHSHQLVCDQEQVPWVLNPGAAGRSRTYGGPSCIILTAKHSRWTIKTYRTTY